MKRPTVTARRARFPTTGSIAYIVLHVGFGVNFSFRLGRAARHGQVLRFGAVGRRPPVVEPPLVAERDHRRVELRWMGEELEHAVEYGVERIGDEAGAVFRGSLTDREVGRR